MSVPSAVVSQQCENLASLHVDCESIHCFNRPLRHAEWIGFIELFSQVLNGDASAVFELHLLDLFILDLNQSEHAMYDHTRCLHELRTCVANRT